MSCPRVSIPFTLVLFFLFLVTAPVDGAEAAPSISRITPTTTGYVITGRGFGRNKKAVKVWEDKRPLPASVITSVTDTRVVVRSKPRRRVLVRVTVGGQPSSKQVAFVHQAPRTTRKLPSRKTTTAGQRTTTAPRTAATPRTAAAGPPPVIYRVIKTRTGYAIVGNNFGTDRRKVQVREGRAVLSARTITGVQRTRIDLRAPLKPGQRITVMIAGKASPPFTVKSAAPTTTATKKPVLAAKKSASARKKPTLQAFFVKIRDADITPTGSKPGDDVRFDIEVETSGAGKRDVEWTLFRDGSKKIRAGVNRNVQAGSKFVIHEKWKAQMGPHTFHVQIDSKNRLNEPANKRADNKSAAVEAFFHDWPGWIDDVKKAVRNGVSAWKGSAMLRNVVVIGPVARGGQVSGPDIGALMQSTLSPGSDPDEFKLKRSLLKAVADAWKSWQGTITVPGLPWYPTFAAHPGPVAPPTPNTPTPLASLVSVPNFFNNNNLKAAMRQRLGAPANWPGADAAIGDLANWVNQRFNTWRSTAVVTKVMGQGPVPTYTPLTPVGPVAGGRAQGMFLKSAPGFMP